MHSPPPPASPGAGTAQGAVAALIGPFARAEARARLWSALAGGGVALCLGAAALRLGGASPVWAVLAAIAVAGGAWWRLRTTCPDAPAMARRIDRRLGTGDLLASALDIERQGPAETVFTHALKREAAALAPRLAGLNPAQLAPATRWRNRSLMAMGISGLFTAFVLVGPDRSPPSLAPTAPPGSRLPLAEDVAAVAEILQQDGDPALAEIARGLEDLAAALATGAPPASAAADLAALASALGAAKGLSQGSDPGTAISLARAEEKLAEWLGAEMGFSGDAPPGPRVAPRVTADLTPRGGDGDAAENDTGPQRMDASVSVDDLDIAAPDSATETRPAAAPGESPFIPPQLIEGEPQTGIAIDMAGTGEAPRQESLESTAGGDGASPEAAPAAPPPPAARSNQELVILYTGITARDQPVHYLTEADRPVDEHEGATLGPLPAYAPRPAHPALRAGLSPREAAALIAAERRTSSDGQLK